MNNDSHVEHFMEDGLIVWTVVMKTLEYRMMLIISFYHDLFFSSLICI